MIAVGDAEYMRSAGVDEVIERYAAIGIDEEYARYVLRLYRGPLPDEPPSTPQPDAVEH